ncbi:O-methyltransferase [Cellulosimicrobium cellulans]|uniref:O-methyltransferase n=1 Tax=Cellulosimicrobium TaxID=157920 RepID=UPI0008882FC1|nr:O-methyltransferase [Cellulosimicrobium cellulans]SDF53245.1 caffeoyl-CoA O-methyltransferase [Cellulosimicrobium cellulans]
MTTGGERTTDPAVTWDAVDTYFAPLVAEDDVLAAASARARDAGLPEIQVSPAQGRLLQLLALTSGARRILEVGTLGGYSTIWLARALPSDGTLVTCEIDPAHAAVARESLAAAGLSEVVDVVVGPAADTLRGLVAGGAAPFDLVFVDADKPSNPVYLDLALQLSRPGTLVVVDNTVRGGAVADATSTDPNVLGVREMADRVVADPRLDATAVQTVGSKGYDGFVLARVRA